jgi:CRP-like cAMP-binding protein
MSEKVTDQSIASFRKGSALAVNGAGLFPLAWTDDDWRCLFQFCDALRVASGGPLIRRSEAGRNLFFIMHGTMEVFAHSTDDLGMGSLSKEGAGTVYGELAFFDGIGRSASVWAIDPCDVAVMTPERYTALEQAHPRIARDLLFGLGRLMATRLRHTTAKVRL